jgi:hypothetical protein
VSSSITDSTDLDTLSSDEDASPSSNDPGNGQNSAPPSLENMMASDESLDAQHVGLKTLMR